MTTQHNPTLPRCSIPLQTCVTARNLPLRHSQNLVTALDVSTCQRPQPLHKFFLSKSALYTPLHTFLSFYDSTKPATMATLLGMLSSIRCSNFRRLNWSSSQLSRGDTRAPAMVLRLQFSVSTVSFSFLAVARLRNQLVMMPYFYGTTHPKIALHRLARRLDRWTAAREAADCVYDLAVGRLTGRTIVAKRRNERHTETELQQSDRWATGSCYSVQRTATRSIHIKSPVPYIQVGISRTPGSLELPQWNPPASWSLP